MKTPDSPILNPITTKYYQGVNVNSRDMDSRTALHFACEQGDLLAVEVRGKLLKLLQVCYSLQYLSTL